MIWTLDEWPDSDRWFYVRADLWNEQGSAKLQLVCDLNHFSAFETYGIHISQDEISRISDGQDYYMERI